MCDLYALYVRKTAFCVNLEFAISSARDNARLENLSATNIQRAFRGKRARDKIRMKHIAANEVERAFRGHLGRKRCKHFKTLHYNYRQMAIFQYFVLQVQKCFRGFYSRKYRQDHARRKRFIKNLENKGDQVRNTQYQYALDQAKREEEEFKNKKNEEFTKYAENLHHLVSTNHIRGVFNPNPHFVQVPTMNDIPIEDHVRGAVKDLLRTRGITKTGLVADLHGSHRIPLKGLVNKLSLQASVPYDTVHQEELKHKSLHKLLTAGRGTFLGGGKTAVIDPPLDPICKGDPFMDQWRNPLLIKGVPQSQQELLESAKIRKPLFVKTLERPFYVRADGNKSTALPNDVFDVMADADETGGPAQRHMGRTSRFGLPENSDNRRKSGTLPVPPARSTTIRPSRPKMRQQTVRVAALGTAGATRRQNSGGDDDSSDGEEKYIQLSEPS